MRKVDDLKYLHGDVSRNQRDGNLSRLLESKREKFVRLTESRVNKALEKIGLLNNLANDSNYDWDKEYVRTAVFILKDEIKSLQNKFVEKKRKIS